ncbi:MAG TPA: tRNA (adenosine(37)-N6)-threonylcarbamoyltransferase complex dimerization subunit type 1 TsaB [Gammaproteobacteria bacterium]|nr:tRNA (adenosine(37)-N6)-threonylcarbamoyltransferase complex dimerization subunit type 1 TsaB [Gammaproteobacteria bacterium]
MNILALDTASRACSVALAAGGGLYERVEETPRRHAAMLLPMAEACLAEAGLTLAELDAVAFGRGPGSFTGLRIAASVAQGVGYGAGLPVVPVSNLAACAVAAWRKHGWSRVLTAFDARMDELYAAPYRVGEDGLAVAAGDEVLVGPDKLEAPAGAGWQGAGSGFAAWPAVAGRLGLATVDAALEPRARDLLGLAADAVARGEAVSAEQALPVYLRERVAWRS